MSPLLRTDPASRCRGFTLVELLVAVAVTAIIMLVLMQSLNQAATTWIGQNKSISAQREARTGLRLLTDDLGALVALPQNPAVAGTGGDARTRFYLGFPSDDHSSARLAFLRASRPDAVQPERGDVRLVLYATALTPDGGASSSAVQTMSQKLMRRVLSTADTFQRIRAHLENGTPLVSAADWNTLAQSAADAEPLAHDVIRFEARPRTAPPRPGEATGTAAAWDDTRIPPWLDVTLRVTNRATAARLSTESDWTGRGAHADWLTNGTPTDYSDDREVRTYSMQVKLYPATP